MYVYRRIQSRIPGCILNDELPGPEKERGILMAITLGDVFEMAGFPLTLSESRQSEKVKRRRRKEPEIKIVMTPEDREKVAIGFMYSLIDMIVKRADMVYEKTGGKVPGANGGRPKTYTRAQFKLFFLLDFEDKLKALQEKEQKNEQ